METTPLEHTSCLLHRNTEDRSMGEAGSLAHGYIDLCLCAVASKQPNHPPELILIRTYPERQTQKMQFLHISLLLAAGLAAASPAPLEEVSDDALTPGACLPASCQSFGVSTWLCKSFSLGLIATVLQRQLRLLVCKYTQSASG